MSSPAPKTSLGKRNASSQKLLSPPLSKRTIHSTTTKSAVSSFFTPVSQKEPEKTIWRVMNDTLLLARHKPTREENDKLPTTKRRRVAAFDLDGTLIQTVSGKRFANEPTDWKWWNPIVPQTLRKLHEDGYRVAIISNQGGISLRPDPKIIKAEQKRVNVFKAKVGHVLNQLDIPMSVFAATAQDQFRKPRTGVWSELLEEYDLDEEEGCDRKHSFFVGDAAGRPEGADARKDFSCSDRNLAANIGITFHTPEEFFLDEDPKSFIRDFEPSDYLSKEDTTSTLSSFTKSEKLEIILFCGSPGSGKSTFYWNHLKPLGYERVNQDILKTRDRCVERALEYLSGGKSVAVDNTNADRTVRAVWIGLAKDKKLPIRCLHFTSPVHLCEHNNAVRAFNKDLFNPENRTILPTVAFTSFKGRLEEPQLTEGFDGLVPVEFTFVGDETQRGVWSKYWT